MKGEPNKTMTLVYVGIDPVYVNVMRAGSNQTGWRCRLVCFYGQYPRTLRVKVETISGNWHEFVGNGCMSKGYRLFQRLCCRYGLIAEAVLPVGTQTNRS